MVYEFINHLKHKITDSLWTGPKIQIAAAPFIRDTRIALESIIQGLVTLKNAILPHFELKKEFKTLLKQVDNIIYLVTDRHIKNLNQNINEGYGNAMVEGLNALRARLNNLEMQIKAELSQLKYSGFTLWINLLDNHGILAAKLTNIAVDLFSGNVTHI